MSMVPGSSTNNSRRTPSAMMMLFFLLSWMPRTICTGSNEEHRFGYISVYTTDGKWFLLKFAEPHQLNKQALRFATISQGTDAIIDKFLSNIVSTLSTELYMLKRIKNRTQY